MSFPIAPVLERMKTVNPNPNNPVCPPPAFSGLKLKSECPEHLGFNKQDRSLYREQSHLLPRELDSQLRILDDKKKSNKIFNILPNIPLVSVSFPNKPIFQENTVRQVEIIQPLPSHPASPVIYPKACTCLSPNIRSLVPISDKARKKIETAYLKQYVCPTVREHPSVMWAKRDPIAFHDTCEQTQELCGPRKTRPILPSLSNAKIPPIPLMVKDNPNKVITLSPAWTDEDIKKTFGKGFVVKKQTKLG